MTKTTFESKSPIDPEVVHAATRLYLLTTTVAIAVGTAVVWNMGLFGIVEMTQMPTLPTPIYVSFGIVFGLYLCHSFLKTIPSTSTVPVGRSLKSVSKISTLVVWIFIVLMIIIVFIISRFDLFSDRQEQLSIFLIIFGTILLIVILLGMISSLLSSVRKFIFLSISFRKDLKLMLDKSREDLESILS